MWTITDLFVSLVGVVIGYAFTRAAVRAFWPERAKYDAPEIYQPMGDSINPQTLRDWRAANKDRFDAKP